MASADLVVKIVCDKASYQKTIEALDRAHQAVSRLADQIGEAVVALEEINFDTDNVEPE